MYLFLVKQIFTTMLVFFSIITDIFMHFIDGRGVVLIRIKLAELLGKHKMRVVDLSERTGVNKNTLYKLYHERSSRMDLEVLERICKHFNCDLSDLIEYDPSYIRSSKDK